MNCLQDMSSLQLLDLPDELILAILGKVRPRVLLLCSMIDIGNERLEQLAFDKCDSIDLTSDYLRAPHKSLIGRFYSDVMPRISHHIRSLTINICGMSSIKTVLENNCNGILPNLVHLKIMLGYKLAESGVPFTLVNFQMSWTTRRKPLFSIIPQFFPLPSHGLGEKLAILCRSSVMHSVQSFELDENCHLTGSAYSSGPRFAQINQLVHIQISFWCFDQCVYLLNEIGLQLQSFTVTIAAISKYEPHLNSLISLVSCPNLKRMTMKMYRNFGNYEPIFSLLQRLSNIEYLTLLLSIDKTGTIPNHFIDGFFLETNIIPYMSCLRQFHFYIRSILKNASHVTVFGKHQQSFDCALDHFRNNYGQYQIYSLPFISTRLDFISNRFPLFDNNNTFSNVTTLLLFDDVEPFESVFFERLAHALPRLHTLEIINLLEQREKMSTTESKVDFGHLHALILFDVHMDYAQYFLGQSHLSSLKELAIDNDILLAMIAQDQQQTKQNCVGVRILQTSKPSYESIDTIRNFFPQVYYVKHAEERHKQEKN